MVDGFRPNQSIWSRGWEDSVILFPLSHWVLAWAVMLRWKLHPGGSCAPRTPGLAAPALTLITWWTEAVTPSHWRKGQSRPEHHLDTVLFTLVSPLSEHTGGQPVRVGTAQGYRIRQDTGHQHCVSHAHTQSIWLSHIVSAALPGCQGDSPGWSYFHLPMSSHPCASSYVTSDHELFSCPLYRLPPPQRERICFWKDPHGSWLETLSLRWNHVFWGVESWGCFSGSFCWFRVGEGWRVQAQVVVGVLSSCSEDTLRNSPPVYHWSCCSFRGGGTSIKFLFVLPGQSSWRLCSVARAAHQLAGADPPHPTPILGANLSLAEKQSCDALLSSTPAWEKQP